MKDGAMLANSGHFDCEINIPELESLSKSRRKVRNNIEEFLQEDGRKIYLLAEGRLVNLAAGDGHPAEIMDLSFGVQFFSMMHLLEHGKELKKEVHLMPNEVNVKLAELKLKSLGMAIDKLTAEQRAYLNME
jgi:adenosylhomocysteinase